MLQKQLYLQYHNWWWLRSPSTKYFHSAACVEYDGCINRVGTIVCDDDIAVRPILRLANLNDTNLKVGDKFIFKDKTFQIISEDMAFCLEDIGTSCFNKDYEAIDANDYEKSDVKKYINLWFNSMSDK